MSLVDQSQKWFPTSVQVTVHQARSLRVKGKNGTNDSYAIMQVAKDKFSTSVAEKSVAPVWKEEASFDLPLFHPGNAERCTLHVIVMHRAQVGLDKYLGQAVINLLDLHDDRSRTKTDWFKLVDKSGKADKVRGEVLLDIQFMRNNMSASMFDLSMQDKPRSRISKLKDKVRGKKKDSFSDSASAIVPSVSQVLTDSDGEADAQSLNQSPGVKKKSKLKSLFAPKSNLQRNISQSMSTLGTLPEKNSSLSGSRSSGLNVDSPEVKKKFKFLGHKRSGSSDSKVSQGPFSLLGRSKQSNSDQNNFCINGSHVYTEETEPKSGSTLSLNSSGQGSVEDVHKHTSDASASRHESTDRAILEQQRHQQEEERRQAEERHIAEVKRVEEEEKYRADARRLQEEEERRYQEEQERNRKFLEDEARRKKQREEEEEEKRKQEEEHRMRYAAENQNLEEERRKSEEQKRQEEASMSDRLSTLFGMIRKKEEKKEEVQQQTKEELPETAPRSDSSSLDQPISHHSTNPFEDIPLSSNESPADPQKSSRNPQTPSAMVFLNRTAKVSAVKPRLVQILESEPPDCQTPSQLCPSPAASESTLSSVPSEPPDSFSNFHSSLPPPNVSKSLSGSPCGSTEDLSSVESEGSSPTMADKKKKAPLPPTYHLHGNQTGGNPIPVREMKSPSYVEADGSQQGKKMSIPLPDYESLFPKKRHGVQGHTRWDHITAEVNQRQRDTAPELLGPEMSVDDPVGHDPSPRSFTSQESPAMRHYQTIPEETKPMSLKKAAAPAPPKPVLSPHPQSIGQNQYTAQQSGMRPNPSAVQGPRNTDLASREGLSGMSRDGARKALQPSPAATLAPRPSIQMDTSPPEDQQKEAPTAKPRQRSNGNEPTQKEVPAADKNLNSNAQTLFSQSVKSMDKKSRQARENLVEFDPFPSTELLSKDPWAQQKQKQKQEVDNLLTGNIQKEQKPEIQGMTADDLDNIFSQDKPTDPFASFSRSNSNNQSPKRKDSEQAGFHAFQRKNSQRRSLTSKTPPEDKGLQSQQEPASKEGTTKMAANQDLVTNDVRKEPVALQPQADVKTQSGFYKVEDQFGAEPFAVPSALTSSEPLQAITEEPGALSGGKTLLQAWVSPSEVQPVSAQNSNGGGQALTARRPHPVKPLTSVESQHATSTQTGKEIKVRDSTPGKIKVADPLGSGPYTQLTQGELITMVVKQQTDLSKKDAKIVELEEYIDNLVVRVIEEKPSILQALNATKQV
ncbi:rab11 family-interacting protein 1 isoform X1 [Hippoglossus hippoglossus]|uniref:rab11 family-interacting protein 1 isoform X1 n=1 Tax=Hippoglossus hippoglossus TaxID=8267 RepID=UPI00148D9809|nr:rab11 family-interacting protein 1 isoform X1 [Hippoglossus hippoglossus]